MKFRILLILLFVLACQKEKKGNHFELNYLPQNASVIVKVNNLDNFKSELKNSDYVEKLKRLSLFTSITKKVGVLDFLDPTSACILGFYEVGKSQEFLLLRKTDTIALNLLGFSDKKVETFTYEKKEITTYKIESEEYYAAKLDDNIFLSSSRLLLENTIRANGNNTVSKELTKLFTASNKGKSASFFLNVDANSFLSTKLNAKESSTIGNFTDWISLDFTSGQNHLLLSGIASATDSTKNYTNLFNGTTPLTERTSQIAPQNSDAILSFTFNDQAAFHRNRVKFLDASAIGQEGFAGVEEVGIIYLNSKKAVAIHSITEGPTDLLENLKMGTTIYQQSDIWNLSDKDFITNQFKPLIKDFNSNYYTVFENAYVFAEDEGTLQTIIANKRSGFTFEKGEVYSAIQSQISNESSLLFISGNEGINHFLDEHFIDGMNKEFEASSFEKSAFAAQLVSDMDFSHFNILMTKIQKTPTNNSVAPLFNLELDSDLTMNPQFVKNHRTNKQEIVVQDRDNNLYLISTEGKVLWKKQLEGQIRGKISQVDIYKNGKLQLAFCTNNQFLILDRNGEEVAPFDKKFEGGNLNALSVFDYEGKKNYRFVVTQGRKVFMYNSQAEIVDGFTFTEAESAIVTNPRHFKINKKDYLIFQLENGKLKILHRAGGERIKVNETIYFSANDVFLYKNKFSTTNKKGVLHQVDTRGKLTATNFNLGPDHGMYATSKTLALMDENVLSIKGKKVEMELGVYTKPTIFYIYDKIYVSVTDIQNQKIYLFDSQAKPIPNFPVYGTSMIDLIDMDNDKTLELVAKDQDNSIIVYDIN